MECECAPRLLYVSLINALLVGYRNRAFESGGPVFY